MWPWWCVCNVMQRTSNECVCVGEGRGRGDVQCALCDTGGVETRGGASKTLDLQYTLVRDVYTVPTSPNLKLVVQQLQYSHLFLELQDDVLQLSLLLLTVPRERGQLGANTRQLLVPHRHQLFKVVLRVE